MNRSTAFGLAGLLCCVLAVATSAPAMASVVSRSSMPLSAGYAMQIESGSTVSTSFVVPTVRCSAADASVSFGVAVSDGSRAHRARVEVDVDCRASRPTYGGWFWRSGERRTASSSDPAT